MTISRHSNTPSEFWGLHHRLGGVRPPWHRDLSLFGLSPAPLTFLSFPYKNNWFVTRRSWNVIRFRIIHYTLLLLLISFIIHVPLPLSLTFLLLCYYYFYYNPLCLPACLPCPLITTLLFSNMEIKSHWKAHHSPAHKPIPKPMNE